MTKLRTTRSTRKGQRRPRGFTLVEVMLAVTLSAFLIGLITTAVYLNVRVLQQQQTEIEQSQIARNVLISITGDLRAAIQYKPADVTGLDSLNVSPTAMLGAVSGMEGLDPSALSSLAGAAAAENSGQEAEPSTANQNIESGQTEVLRPGLYGNSTEIMIDISRLPRVDQYDPLVTGTQDVSFQLPTDVKTVAYFVSEQSEASQQLSIGDDAAASGGLYRRELDRAVASFSPDLASTLASLGSTKLIANEVIGIQFRYFDGESWVDQWDSDQEGGFPAAVEVTIMVDNRRLISEDVSYSMQENQQTGTPYRTVVNLPVAEILPDEESGGASSGGTP